MKRNPIFGQDGPACLLGIRGILESDNLMASHQILATSTSNATPPHPQETLTLPLLTDWVFLTTAAATVLLAPLPDPLSSVIYTNFRTVTHSYDSSATLHCLYVVGDFGGSTVRGQATRNECMWSLWKTSLHTTP